MCACFKPSSTGGKTDSRTPPVPGLLDRVRKPDECAWTTEYVGRALSLPLTRLALSLGLSANTVTLLAGAIWLISLPTVVASGWQFQAGAVLAGWCLLALAAILWNLGYLLDLVDGNLARVKGTACLAGFYLDYVFHLLFKPAFLASIAGFLALARNEPGWLVLGVLTIPANWSATESAVEHVVAQSCGKGTLSLSALTTSERRRLLLGLTDIQHPLANRQHRPLALFRMVVREILSYYGQFSFFSLLVAGDAIMALAGGPVFLLLRLGLLGVGLLMVLRLPWRIRRDFRRVRLLDDKG